MKKMISPVSRLLIIFLMTCLWQNSYAQQDTTKAETNATFPGGINGWRKYIERNLNYPKAAQENNTQGVIRVQMTVTELGKILNVSALNNPGDGLAEEAVRVVKIGPDWLPATKNGKPVAKTFVQTITFKLAGPSTPRPRFR